MNFLLYVAIQIAAYVIDMGTFFLLVNEKSLNPLIANIAGKFFAGCFAFLSHRYITFDAKDKINISGQLIRYLALFAINIPLSSGILAVLLIFISEPSLAKFLSDIICVVLTYTISKKYVFVKNIV